MRCILKKWGFDGVSLVGDVYDYPDKPDGRRLVTSNLMSMYYDDDQLIGVCISREYLLIDMDPVYEKMFPSALKRLLYRFEHKFN
jgi:hypothetical protein